MRFFGIALITIGAFIVVNLCLAIALLLLTVEAADFGLGRLAGILAFGVIGPSSIVGGLFCARRSKPKESPEISLDDFESGMEQAQDKPFHLGSLNRFGWLLTLTTFAFVGAEVALIVVLLAVPGHMRDLPPWPKRIGATIFLFCPLVFFVGMRLLYRWLGVSIQR